MRRLLVITVLLFSGSHPAVATSASCQKYMSKFRGEDVSYCVQRSTTDTPKKGEPVIYFFHGLTGNGNSWIGNGYSVALHNLSQASDLKAVTFVSFDTNPASFFADYNDTPSGAQAYETWFLTEFMPMIETQFGLCKTRTCRGAIGLSMGGFGALKTALRHPDLFGFAGANSPALTPMNVWEDETQWSDFFALTPLGSDDGLFFIDLVRKIFPTPKNFDAHDPAVLAENFSGQKPSLYFDMGSQDDFGFEHGFAHLQTVLTRGGWSYTSVLVAGADHSLFTTRRYDLLKWALDQLP